MLIEFSVTNFRSFRERQTLTMVAAPGLRKENNLLAVPVDGEQLPALLKVAAIYGPNASGKSNLLQALDAIPEIARYEPSSHLISLPVSSFRFDAAQAGQPSKFEIHFVENRTRYAFTLAATAERIIEERLTVFPKGEEQLLYHRKRVADRDEYQFGAALEGDGALHETWSKATNAQALFLSRAVANSNEELKQLRHPHRWLTHSLDVIIGGLGGWQQSMQSLIEKHPSMADDVVKLLNENDIPVTAIQSERVAPWNALRVLKDSPPASHAHRTTLTHRTALSEARFDFSEESEGTKNLFGFALPWSLVQEASAEYATSVLVVDEFDSSLHPDIVATMVRKHIESDLPRQLIFTTHDTHLMTTDLLRRDQFWLTERDANGATQLRSIHDFKGRESDDMEKRYFEGRYRGLPLIRRS